MSVDHLLVNDDGAVLEFVFNRSDRGNALTYRMAIEMTDRIVDAARGDITRVIVIRGEGKDFCSGMDLVESNASTGQKPRAGNLERRMSWGPHRLMEAISAVQLPVVTVVRGYAAGIGFALALSGDYIVADDTAKFWAPYVARGFTPDSGITWLVPKLVGMARAKDALLRARKINAEEAHEWGMINALVSADDLEAESQLVVDEFARAATISVGLTKQLLNQQGATSYSDALKNEAITEELAVRTRDFAEGMKAFAQHREAEFTGG